MHRFLVAASLVSASLISAAPEALAECRSGWCKVGCYKDGSCMYVKLISRNYPYVIYLMEDFDQSNKSNYMFEYTGDCQQFKYKITGFNGNPISNANKDLADLWRSVMPGSSGEAHLQRACNM